MKFSEMVCFAIVARLYPAQSRLLVASILRNSDFLFSFDKYCPEFREIAATKSLLCTGSRRATIAKQTNFKTLEFCGYSEKRINALQAVLLTFLGDQK